MGIYIILLLCVIGPVLNVPLPPNLQIMFPNLKTLDSKIPTIEGDILIHPSGRSAINCASCLWPKSANGAVIVPYNLSSSYNTQQVSLFNSSMQEFHTLTCIRFVPQTTEKDFLNIVATGDCSSFIGKVGGGQVVNLAASGCMSKGTIQHELEHNLGFYHEHSRSDRDDYITIMTEYISPGIHQFICLSTNNLGLEYDYGSVMHYPRYAFSNSSGNNTIVPKPDPSVPIGQRYGLSPLDVSKINRLYQCDVCATLLNTIKGTLTSANYPSAYPQNSRCVWLIRIQSGKDTEVIYKKSRSTFNAFDVQSSPGCVSDYIKIYDGPSKTSPLLLDRSCGSGVVPLLMSSASQMLIEFVSDGSLSATGFKATYTSDSGLQCGAIFYALANNFTTPNFPYNYPPNMNCIWKIIAPAGYKIKLTLKNLVLEDAFANSCSYDSLSIYNGLDTSLGPSQILCGIISSRTVYSAGNSMTLQFSSDQSNQFKGFQASYVFVWEKRWRRLKPNRDRTTGFRHSIGLKIREAWCRASCLLKDYAWSYTKCKPNNLKINIRNYQNLLSFVFAITEINRNKWMLPNITLGFHIVDSCFVEEKAVMGMFTILSGNLLPVPNYRYRHVSALAGFVEGISSKVSLLLARLFTVYRIPQISYSSLDPVLSDKIQFPSFYRTVPNDNVQLQAIVKLIKYFGWSWIGLLVSDNESGLEASQMLQKGLLRSGVCVSFLEFIPYRDGLKETTQTQIVNVLRISSVNVIILYGDRDYMLTLQLILYQFSIPEKVWIISSQWDVAAGLDFHFLSFKPFNGSLAFTLHSTDIHNFEPFLLNMNPDLYPNDIFLKDVWWEIFLCVWRAKNTSRNGCTGTEHLYNSSYPYFSSDISVYSYSIYSAVYVLANALHILFSQNNVQLVNKRTPIVGKMHRNIQSKQQAIQLCIGRKSSYTRSHVHKYLKYINFTNHASGHILFDDHRDMLYSRFDVLNWIVYPNQTMNAIKVGTFDQLNLSEDLLINRSLVRWNSLFNQTPLSECSETCFPGYRKSPRNRQPSCCYDCIPCPEGEISNQTNMEKCFKCPKEKWPNMKKDTCFFKLITYLSYEEPLGKSMAVTSSLLAAITYCIVIIFMRNQNTPIVRANNQHLSYILLVSLKMCFLCIFLFIGHPHKVICILRQAVFGVAFSISVSSILAKTVIVVLAFNATKPGSKLQSWIKSMISNAIVVICTLVQISVCIVWLVVSPPFPYNNMADDIGKIIAECKEGSAVGFYSVLGYNGFLALVSFFVAFLARDLPDMFNEARFITFSMLVFLSVWISFIPAYLSTKGKYVVVVEIFAILASSTGIIVCIFIPKCYVILFRPERNKSFVLMNRHKKDRI
ncbi:vomeronasal type-2 receptor 26-like [Pelobates cultripes]|uniref:Astacin-like metalloendopeptidase n=1 Tax=Pelobates cultripes TaxID=61616 RepID=A0AAD1WXL5_PELCU|nr:vomeronasal type-2 receptor 26-like [Pelobates cultripes]